MKSRFGVVMRYVVVLRICTWVLVYKNQLLRVFREGWQASLERACLPGSRKPQSAAKNVLAGLSIPEVILEPPPFSLLVLPLRWLRPPNSSLQILGECALRRSSVGCDPSGCAA